MKKKCVILTGARAPVTLDLARQFAAQGHRVVVAETVPFHFCRFTRAISKNYTIPRPGEDPEGFIKGMLDISKRESADLIIPTLEEVFYLANHHSAFSKGQLFCDPIEKLRLLHNKWEFYQLLIKLGLTAPQTWLLKNAKDFEGIPAYKKIVVKPAFSRFATHVYILTADEYALPIGAEITPEHPWIAQEYIQGTRLSSYSVVQQGEIRAHATYPIVFHVGENGSCLAFEPIEHTGIQEWVQTFVQKTQFTGQIAFDFIEEPSGRLMVIECNPRSTSGAHLFGEEDNLPQAFFSGSVALLKPNPNQRKQMFLAMLMYAWGSAIRQGKLQDFIRCLVTSKDVVWRWDDPLPFLAQPLTVGMYWLIGKQLNKGAIEASTYDIDWNG